MTRSQIPPRGLNGGGDARPFRVTVHSPSGERVVGGQENLALRRGDLVLVETCGGGGHGAAAGRAAELRARDRRKGYV